MSDATMVQQTPDGAAQRGVGTLAMSSAGFGDESLAAGQYAALFELTRGNAEAMLKATEIFARGLKMLQTAVVGSACMAIDDAISETRVAMSCRNWPQFIAFEAENAPISAHRCLLRAYTLYRMATQLIEDAAFPLERRFALAMGLLCQKAL